MRFSGVAAALGVASCLVRTADADPPALTIHPRIHSAGYFPFTGALLNLNPVADVTFFYEKEGFGFFLFQSVDLADRHSFVNYFQPGVFASFNVHRSLRIRTIFGYVFSQTQGFRDGDSDYYALATVNWGFSKHLRLENSLQFYDFYHNTKLSNRLLLEWSARKFRTALFLWQRVALDDPFSSASAALSLTFPIIELGEKASLDITSSYMGYLSARKPDFALRNGFFLTVAVPITLK